MPRLDHLSLPVRDWRKSRDWYQRHLGFELEFEIPERKTAAMRDDADLTMFLYEGEVAACPGISFTIQWTMSRPSTPCSLQPGCLLFIRRCKSSGAMVPSCMIPTGTG